ncbi:MAG: Gfo/Idh/MocA family oxidoreductase, partial [Armatimonadetes bacterium]|nr:Gfo/Idh/MocA family oxidoreductase [Candidatus Hippobium faecium]
MEKTKVGIIGCGNILWAYMKGNEIFNQIEMVGCADILPEKAKEAEEKYGIKAYNTVEDLLANPEIEIVVNITVPKAHAEVDRQILNAGKHVFSEKPMAVEVDDAKDVLALAESKGLRVGCAPDTFMGAGTQTCIKLINEGWIGDVVAVNANMIGGSPMGWHPNPDFFFKKGAGPMLDMGPYYMTALIAMFGPIKSVTGVSFSKTEKKPVTFPVERVGEVVEVEVPLHNNGIYEFESGVTCNFTCSFEAVGGSTFAPFEVYGTKGTLLVPDPNSYGMPIKLRLPGQEEHIIPYSHNYTDYMRGIGVADMAMAIKENRPHRANGKMACHVLDALLSTYVSSDLRKNLELSTTCDQPAPLPE